MWPHHWTKNKEVCVCDALLCFMSRSRLWFPRCRWISPQADIKGIQSNQLQNKLRANKFMMKPPVTLVAPMCRRSLNPAPWKDYVQPPRGVKSLKCSEKAAGRELVSLSPSVHLPALVSGGVSHLEALMVAAPRLSPSKMPDKLNPHLLLPRQCFCWPQGRVRRANPKEDAVLIELAW